MADAAFCTLRGRELQAMRTGPWGRELGHGAGNIRIYTASIASSRPSHTHSSYASRTTIRCRGPASQTTVAASCSTTRTASASASAECWTTSTSSLEVHARGGAATGSGATNWRARSATTVTSSSNTSATTVCRTRACGPPGQAWRVLGRRCRGWRQQLRHACAEPRQSAGHWSCLSTRSST
jgi:hypothetical protein